MRYVRPIRNERTTLIGGTISIAAVILLSAVGLDRDPGTDFFMQGMSPTMVEVKPAVEDSTTNPCGEDPRR